MDPAPMGSADELQRLSARAGALAAAGRWPEAEAALLDILKRVPRHAETWSNLGTVRIRAGRSAEALEAFRKAVRLDPKLAAAHVNLATLLFAAGKMDEAETHCRKAVRAAPNSAMAAKVLGDVLLRTGRLDEAEREIRRALGLQGDYVEALNTLSSILKTQGRLAEAIEACRRSLAIRYNDTAARNLVMALSYDPDCTPDAYFEAQRLWASHQGGERLALDFDRSPECPLRIGYLSADFHEHPVARNVVRLIESHDQSQFIAYAYSLSVGRDAMTDRIAGAVREFRVVGHLDSRKIAETVRADGIDVLVSLAGWTGDNRPSVCALRPAPLQISWHDLGSSGLETMDAWLTDAALHPPGATAERFTETLVRLPCFYLHEIPDQAPEPGPPPMQANGRVTFGSFNNPAKINESTLAFWGRVLAAVPGSEMLLKYRETYADKTLRARIREALGQAGIAPERVRFETSALDRRRHLGLYGEVDIGLDCFPFNGSTTTFEALFMGVPVVGPAGDRFVARCGLSLLSQVGLAELAPESLERAVEAAVRLASDPEALAALRADLRRRVLDSRLCDAPAYAREFEAAVRELWRRRCAGTLKQPPSPS